ncbi:hypothetical protein DM01DRAFT_1340761 [Hesseltinella vesiculosa]|uniref:GATA-type domain-containing protein n=1 Tax=Hesseltinella vesiculosa TaxID=101127 RepID=A0A1X2G362_9FUNG|nr:hypothetical protein DM01DRAFT_1340761 [Hesseltinella vesiculosa]
MTKRKRSQSLSSWMLDIFDSYALPCDESMLIDQGLHYRIRCLGKARLHVHDVLFFEVTKSEISENDERDKEALPLKKRKKRNVIYSIVFTLVEPDNTSIQLDRPFFVFPSHCLVELVSTAPPFELCCTFFPPSLLHQPMTKEASTELSYRHQRRWTDPGRQPNQEEPMTLPLSGASLDLYQSIKQVVLHYEATCQQLLELTQRHTQRLATVQKSKKPATASSRRSSANTNKQCSYCHSKTTPMWRRGPEGAGTLCNACGVKWKNGKLIIAKKSPSLKSDDTDMPLLSSGSSSESPLPSFQSSPSPPSLPQSIDSSPKHSDPPNKLQDVEAATLLTLLKQSSGP